MKELEFLLETYKKSVFEKDLETFLSLFDEEVRVFDMWARWSFDGLAVWRESVTEWFSSLGDLRDRITFEDVQILPGSDLAAVTAFARFAAISPEGEELRFLHNRLTLIVRKTVSDGNTPIAVSAAGISATGGWKIIHQHTSTPIDGETLKAMLKRP